MSQVPFVAICQFGHLRDFPFKEWVHKSARVGCRGTLRLESRGGGGLGGQVVVCDEDGKPQGCGAERSLEGIMSSRWKNGAEFTYLTDNLVGSEEPFYCDGQRPWLGQIEGSCGEPLRGALRAAGNVYFPKVESSIYLPRQIGAVSAELRDLLDRADVRPVLRILNKTSGANVTVADIRAELPDELFTPISDQELFDGYCDIFGIGKNDKEESEAEPEGGDDTETLTGSEVWRYPEYELLRETPTDDYLTATDPGRHSDLEPFLARVRRVEALRETRALRGFTRVRDGALRLSHGKQLLRRRSLSPANDWLPAYVVKGEGIYLELDRDRVTTWELRDDVQARASMISARYGSVASARGLLPRRLSPRFILVHTLAHVLINELVFACGYSSASLRERLYVSDTHDRSMVGLLLYTAAGDSEGTMGGLVRMARPEMLQPIFSAALVDATWCSTDPVCMDSGDRGQGPDSCNLAACHGCALLPETSCEEFNRFLDRGLLVGTFANPEVGYFSDSVLARAEP